MINLMINKVFENTNKIESVIKCVKKTNKLHALEFVLLALTLNVATVVILKHENKINEQEERIKELEFKLKVEEIKSKGE